MGVIAASEQQSVGEETLRADGYKVISSAPVTPDMYDGQGHLNNAAIGVLFNDLRISYIRHVAGAWWSATLLKQRFVVAARESHILYESEGFPGETYVGSMRYVRLEGKAAVLEQRLVESTTGRSVARAWVVQLLVHNGSVVEWPEEYFDRVQEAEGTSIEQRPKAPRIWGPGE